MPTTEEERIANHLNILLCRATAYHWTDGYLDGGPVGTLKRHDAESDKLLWARLEPILAVATIATDLAEIAVAATERRHANLNRPDVNPHAWRMSIPWAGSQQLWDACRPQLEACVNQFNVETAATYELFRLACSQGVAVPPA